MDKWKFICGMAVVLLLTGCADNIHSDTDQSENDSISVYIQQANTTTFGIWTGKAAEYLYESTRLHVEVYPHASMREEKLKQYMVAGTLPDLIGFRGLEQAQVFMDASLLVPLEDYADMLPSIFENPIYEKAIQYSKEYLSRGSDSLYLIPVGIGWAAEEFEYLPMLRWQPYNGVGTPLAVTLEDYLDIVEEMLLNAPISNMGETMYGFSLSGERDFHTAGDVAKLGYLYGIDMECFSTLMETDIRNNTTSSILKEDSFYKRALHFYFSANQRGMLDPDSRNQTYRNLEKKVERGQVMFACSTQMVGSYNDYAAEGAGYLGQPDGYVPIAAKDMKIYKAGNQVIGNNQFYGIVNTTGQIESVCRFLNWYYSQETLEEMYRGSLEEDWDVSIFHDLALLSNVVNEDSNMVSTQTTTLEQEVFSFLKADSVNEYLIEHKKVVEASEAINMVPFVPEDLRRKSNLIGDRICKVSWEMIYAHDEEVFEKLWNTLCLEAEELGMKDIEEFYIGAWEQALMRATEGED